MLVACVCSVLACPTVVLALIVTLTLIAALRLSGIGITITAVLTILTLHYGDAL